MSEDHVSPPTGQVLTIAEAADFLKVSYSTCHAMTKTGELPTWRPARNRRIVRIHRSDLEKVLRGDSPRAA